MSITLQWLKDYVLDIGPTNEAVLPYYDALEGKQRMMIKRLRSFTGPKDPEYYRSKVFRSKCYWMCLYLTLSLLLTLDNKFTMAHFPFPCAMTGLHALFNFLSLTTLWLNGTYRPKRLRCAEVGTVFAFSFLYSLNIVLSNVSLEYASLPMHQTFRSLTPLFVVLISIFCLGKQYTTKIYCSLAIISLGVLLTTVSDWSIGLEGLLIGLLAACVASLKTICTTTILKTSYSKLSPLDLIFYISPLTCVLMMVTSYQTQEMQLVRAMWGSTNYLAYLQLTLSGVIAVSLNIVSFTANKYTGAVAMSVAESFKQVLTIALAGVFFRSELNLVNAIGLVTALLGGAWYGQIEYSIKKAQKDFLSPPGSPNPNQEYFPMSKEKLQSQISSMEH